MATLLESLVTLSHCNTIMALPCLKILLCTLVASVFLLPDGSPKILNAAEEASIFNILTSSVVLKCKHIMC